MYVEFDTITYGGDMSEYPTGRFTSDGDIFDMLDKDLPSFTLPMDEQISIFVNGEEIEGTVNEVLIKLDRSNSFLPLDEIQ